MSQALMDCSKVAVRANDKGAGVYATQDISAGELVEYGIVRRLPAAFDGNDSPHVFTWSEDRTVWAIGSGASTFYNCSTEPNTKMTRIYDEDRFEIHATRDISAGEELLHTYKSLQWRECFEDLR